MIAVHPQAVILRRMAHDRGAPLMDDEREALLAGAAALEETARDRRAEDVTQRLGPGKR